MQPTKKLGVAVVAAAGFMALAACGGESEMDKAGGEASPVTLRIGNEAGPGRPEAFQIEEFARQVEELSEGRLHIEPMWHAAGKDVDDWDQAVARMVVAGELDMGMIPARAWDTEGVTSLRALNAPFLVTLDELLARIVTGDLAGEMLTGLEAIDVTGLALLPDAMRYLFAFGDPPLTEADFDGKLIRAPRSDTTYALFEALGATPDDFGDRPGDYFTEAINAGSVVAAETSFPLAGTLDVPARTTVVGNLPLFPKVNSLVINSDAFNDLGDEQQTILQDAARRTVDWAITQTRPDAEAAQKYCDSGGRIVHASEDQIDQFHRATESVVDELNQDDVTRAMIAEISRLRSELDVAEPAVAPCAESIEAAPVQGEAAEAEFPEGIYRMEMTADFLIDAGIDNFTASNHAGIWTLTFADGVFQESTCAGTYAVESARVTITLGNDPTCGTAANKVLFSAGWILDGDQLQFVDVLSGHGSDVLIEALFGGKPFTKIG